MVMATCITLTSEWIQLLQKRQSKLNEWHLNKKSTKQAGTKTMIARLLSFFQYQLSKNTWFLVSKIPVNSNASRMVITDWCTLQMPSFMLLYSAFIIRYFISKSFRYIYIYILLSIISLILSLILFYVPFLVSIYLPSFAQLLKWITLDHPPSIPFV